MRNIQEMDTKSCYEIINISSLGLTLKHGQDEKYICFDECAKNYANEKHLASSKCVAERDISKRIFIFYTNPKTKISFKKNFLNYICSGRSADDKFSDLQKAINQYGYTTYDLS